MSALPAFAAVIPCRNGMPHVIDAIASVLAQTRSADEVILVEDGSDDGTLRAVRERFDDRVRIVEGRFGSPAAARNAGWRAARSAWVGFLDADDVWFEDKLEVAAAALENAPDAQWFFSDGAFRTLEGELHASWMHTYADLNEGYLGQPVAELLEVNFILTSSVVALRGALEAEGGFNESMSHAEDLDLWIRLARRAPATASRRALVRYQHLETGMTRQVERRLLGDVELFSRLAADRSLAPDLRDVAGRRASLARYKLAVSALRDARGGEARRWAWRARRMDRSGAVAGLWLLSWLPSSWVRAIRGQRWFTERVAAPLVRLRRVALRSRADLAASRRSS